MSDQPIKSVKDIMGRGSVLIFFSFLVFFVFRLQLLLNLASWLLLVYLNQNSSEANEKSIDPETRPIKNLRVTQIRLTPNSLPFNLFFMFAKRVS